VAASTACNRHTTTSATEKSAVAAVKASHVFRGTVQTVNVAGKTMSVANENTPGWMDAMTMTYKVSNPEVLASIKVGDRIAATVYDGDFQSLYDVEIDEEHDGPSKRRPSHRVCRPPADVVSGRRNGASPALFGAVKAATRICRALVAPEAPVIEIPLTWRPAGRRLQWPCPSPAGRALAARGRA
jgi:Cu/Ag efflux protein CusF